MYSTIVYTQYQIEFLKYFISEPYTTIPYSRVWAHLYIYAFLAISTAAKYNSAIWYDSEYVLKSKSNALVVTYKLLYFWYLLGNKWKDKILTVKEFQFILSFFELSYSYKPTVVSSNDDDDNEDTVDPRN